MSVSEHLLMPKLGLTMAEGTVARWAVRPGARFDAGDVIVVIETDKIANDVEAPAAGTLEEILAPEGATVPVSTPIARWQLAKPDGCGTARREAILDPAARPGPVSPVPRSASQAISTEAIAAGATAHAGGRRLLSTPYARKLAREAGIDIAGLTGSGPRGRISAADVLKAKAETSLRPVAGSSDLSNPVAATPIAQGIASPTVEALHGEARSHERLVSFANVELDTSSMRAIESSPAIPTTLPLRLALVLIAVDRASPGWAKGAIGILSARRHGQRLALFTSGHATTLSRTAQEVHAALSAAELLPVGDAGGAILIVAGTDDVGYFAPAVPRGWTAAIGLGAERETLRRSGDGGIVEAHSMALAFSYDAERLPHADALEFLARLKQLLEEPLGMLARQP